MSLSLGLSLFGVEDTHNCSVGEGVPTKDRTGGGREAVPATRKRWQFPKGGRGRRDSSCLLPIIRNAVRRHCQASSSGLSNGLCYFPFLNSARLSLLPFPFFLKRLCKHPRRSAPGTSWKPLNDILGIPSGCSHELFYTQNTLRQRPTRKPFPFPKDIYCRY